MALTKIVTGMEKGPEAIEQNFEALDGNSPKILTDWSSDGISYKNGCTQNVDTPNRVQYRVIQLGDSKILLITGWFNAPALDFNQAIIAFTLPTNVVSQVNKFGLVTGTELNSWGDILFGYDLNRQTGDFSIRNKSSRGDGKVGASGYLVNYGLLVQEINYE